MRARAPWLVAVGGFVMGASSVVAGAGFGLTPVSGSLGERFGAFGDPWMEPALGFAGVAGGTLVAACAMWLAVRLRDGVRPGIALGSSAVLAAAFVVAAKAGLWLFARADPPLPSSWNWIQAAFAVGLLGSATWLAGVVIALRPTRESRG